MGSRRRKRIMAGCLAAVTLCMSMPGTVVAAEPQVSVDETMYVNLDYYGAMKQVSVVKGCTTNGVTQFTDYGTYEKVVNMTDSTEPVTEGDSVTWNLNGDKRRFYYEGVMNPEQVQLPWNFDISYKWNGVEKKAEELAGASGLIEIHVKAEPNDQADLYYQNNMMLAVIFPVDMEKCYSVEAPGAQIQSVGTQTVAVFAALPGEEGDFTIRIGTDNYESIGAVMMMTPGRLDALGNIRELKEAKDTWKEDGDKMYESLDQVLQTMESMKGDVNQLKNGLSSLDRARAIASENRPALESSATAALNDLDQLTVWTAALVPYLQTARQAVSDINDNTRSMSVTMNTMADELDDLYGRLGGLRDDLEKVSQIDTISPEEQAVIFARIQQNAAAAKALVDTINGMLGSLTGTYQTTEEEWNQLKEGLDYAATGDFEEDETASPSELDYWIPEEYTGEFDEMSSDLEMLQNNQYLEEVRMMLTRLSQILGDTQSMGEQAATILSVINDVISTTKDTAYDSAKVVSSIRGADEQLVELLDEMSRLMDTLDQYEPSMMESLRCTEDLMTGLSRTLDSSHQFLSVVDRTLKAAGDSIDEGTKATMEGAIELLEKSLELLDDTSDVREAGADMKETMDQELDKFETENNFLNMDTEAEMVSFTSSKNQEPNSLQIIVRTDEISEDQDPTDISDQETAAAEDIGPFARMWNVIVKMFQAVVEVFKNR